MEKQKKQGMENFFVGYELAKELKDMGFDEDCLAFYYYMKMPMLTLCEPELYNKLEKHNLTLLKAPLWQQVTRWFMKKHNLLGVNESNKSIFINYICRTINIFHIFIPTLMPSMH